MRVEVVIETLRHDGERLKPGTVIELSKAAAQDLIESGAVIPAKAKKGEK